MRISGVTFATRKTHKARNVIVTITILLLLAILATVAISAYNGWELLHPIKKDIEAFSANIVPEYRDISFKGKDNNVILSGWHFQAKNKEKTVILAHSYGNNRLQFGLQTVDMIKAFLDKGYNVFAFDFRNSGKSGGKLTSLGYNEKDDLLGAIDYITQQGSKHIILMGFSTGASASILAAAENKSVDAVIADSPYADLKDYLDNNLNTLTKLPPFPFNKTVLISMEIFAGMDTANASPINSIANLAPCRLFLIHGKGDRLIPVENSLKLYSAYSKINADGVELWETDDTGNAASYLKYPAEYMDKVFAFLDKAQ